MSVTRDWARTATFYEAYVRSFQDSDGDGVGDLSGVLSRLDHLVDLGVDALWLTPIFASPMKDHGYDVADYRVVDPLFGSLGDLDRLISLSHERGLRLLLDIVPNHTSDQHPWFRSALVDASRPGPRDRYLFRPAGPGGGPPNNWQSVFGGSAWTWVGDEYYLHLFAEAQPDLNWRNADVVAEFEDILRFWFARDVDGFRIDVAHGLVKDAALRDQPDEVQRVPGTDYQGLEQTMVFDQPEVHEIFRAWRRIADTASPSIVLMGEVYLQDPSRAARYGRPDELDLVLAFGLTTVSWDAAQIAETVSRIAAAYAVEGATPAWVLDSHDVARSATRLGGGEAGRQRSLALTLVQLALPGAAIIYQGQELGLEDGQIRPEDRTDPIFRMSGGTLLGRDGCRIPMPWDEARLHAGFTTGRPWLPQPPGWAQRSVAAQASTPGSFLSVVTSALHSRRRLDPSGIAQVWEEAGRVIVRRSSGGRTVLCVCNVSGEAEYPSRGEIVVSTNADSVRRTPEGVLVPAGEAAWVLE